MSLSVSINSLRARIAKSDIASRMASATFWSTVGVAVGRLLVLVASMVCAHLLGKEIYGQYGMVKSTVAAFMALGGGGMGLAATKYISQYWRDQKHRVSSIYFITNGFAVLLALLMAAVLYFAASWIAEERLNAPEMVPSLKLSALIVIFVIINVAQEGVLAGFEDFKGKAIVIFFGCSVQALALIAGAYFGGLDGTICGYGLGFVVLSLMYKVRINRNMREKDITLRLSAVQASDLKMLYKFCLPAALLAMLVAPTYFVIRLLLKDYLDFKAMADYDVGDQWRLMILFVPAAVSHIVLPILSSFNNAKDKFWKVLYSSMLINGCVALLLALLVCLFSGVIVNFYGHEFTNRWPLIIFALSTVVTSASAVLGMSIASLAHLWTSLAMNLLWAVVAIALTKLFLMMGMGPSGPALAILLSYVEHTVVQYLYVIYVYRKKGAEQVPS